MAVQNTDYYAVDALGETLNVSRNVIEDFKLEAKDWGETAKSTLGEAFEGQLQSGAIITPPGVPAPPGLSYTKPSSPVAPNVSFTDPSLPTAVSLPQIDNFTPPVEPTATFDTDFTIAAASPGNLQSISWGEAPDVTVPEIGTAPTVTAPTAPTVGNFTIPAFSGLTIPDVTVTIPTSTFPSVSNTIDYSSTEFTSSELDAVMVESLEIIYGRMAVAQHIWNAIWSRVAGNLARQAVAIDRKARREHSKLGWSMPGNLARLAEAKQDINEKISSKAIEEGVQQALQNREDYWKATETINAGVTLMQQADTTHQERLLKVALAVQQAEIAALDAAIKHYNALLQAASIQMQSKELELKGELAELDVYKAQLEGVAIQSEIDKNRVALYTSEWEGQKTKVQAYAEWVNAIKTYVDAQRSAVEAYGEEVRAKQGIVQAWSTEWDAYTKQLEVPRLKIQRLDSQVSKYGQDVALHGQRIQSERERVNVNLEKNRLTLEESAQALERYRTQWTGVDTKLKALTGVYSTDGQIYTAKGQVEASRLNALTSIYSSEVQAARLDLDASIENARSALGYWQAYSQSLSAWQSAVSSTYSQLGASAYSASHVSFGASGSANVGLGYNESDSTSTSTNYNYSY